MHRANEHGERSETQDDIVQRRDVTQRDRSELELGEQPSKEEHDERIRGSDRDDDDWIREGRNTGLPFEVVDVVHRLLKRDGCHG